MNSVRIVLDNQDAYFPGQTVNGRVECNFNEKKSLTAVRIKFKGFAETDWVQIEKKGAERNVKSKKVRYIANEIYFEAEYNLVQGGENFILSPGKHSYPFSYILPPQLPSSYSGSHGNVRYYVKATIDCPWKSDFEDEIILNIISPHDLNYFPQLREPVTTSVDKIVCSCWCNKSNRLNFNMSLPVTGFVPGQEIKIACRIENMTSINVKSVKFKIIEQTECKACFPSTISNYQKRVVAECAKERIGSQNEKAWISCIIFPPEYYSNLNPCTIINISYLLQAKVVLPCPYKDLENYTAISIGTIPLNGVTTIFPKDSPTEVQYFLPFDSTSEQNSLSMVTIRHPSSDDAKYHSPIARGISAYSREKNPSVQYS